MPAPKKAKSAPAKNVSSDNKPKSKAKSAPVKNVNPDKSKKPGLSTAVTSFRMVVAMPVSCGQAKKGMKGGCNCVATN